MKMIALIIISIANLACSTAMVLCCDDNKRFSPAGIFLSMLLFELLVVTVLFPSAHLERWF